MCANHSSGRPGIRAEVAALDRLRFEAARNDRIVALDLFLHGRPPEALVYLARALAYAPDDPAAAELAVSMLNDWKHPIPSAVCVGHRDRVISVWFSPDGRRLVTCSGERAVPLWDVLTGELIGVIAGHSEALESVRFSEDSRRFVTASGDRTVRIWALEDARLELTIEIGDTARLAQFASDNQLLLVATSHDVEVRDASAGSRLRVVRGGKLPGWGEPHYRFSANGERVAVTSSGEQAAYVWDTESGHTVGCYMVRGEEPGFGAEFSPDGRWLVTAWSDGMVRVWELLGTDKPPPAWFGDFLCLMAQHRFEADGELVTLRTEELLTLQKKLAPAVANESSRYAAIAGSFLSRLFSCRFRIV